MVYQETTIEDGVFHHDAFAKTAILNKNNTWLESLS